VPVPFHHVVTSVNFCREGAVDDLGRPCAEPHASAFFANATLFFEQGDHRFGSVLVELGAVSVFNSADISREFNRGYLHAEAKAEIWDFVLAGEPRCFDLSLDTARPETARDQNTDHIS